MHDKTTNNVPAMSGKLIAIKLCTYPLEYHRSLELVYSSVTKTSDTKKPVNKSRELTCSGPTWQKLDIFSLTVWSIGFSERHNIRSGDKPSPLNSLTDDCVGFVLGSPVDFGCKPKHNVCSVL